MGCPPESWTGKGPREEGRMVFKREKAFLEENK